MKNYIAIIFLLLLSGCSATKVIKLHNLSEAEKTKVVLLKSNCDASCKKAITQELQLFPTASLAKITIQSINGVKGTTSHTSNCGGSGFYNIYNDLWSWGFNIELSPGNTELGVYSSNCNITNRTMHNMRVSFEPGHIYVLALITRKLEGAGYYANESIEWYPVMYDETTKKLLVNNTTYGWLVP